MRTTVAKKRGKKIEKIGENDMRRNSDVQSFYKFISTNNLRHEAHVMLSHVVGILKSKSKKRKTKKIIQ